jgi:hypothetical protein
MRLITVTLLLLLAACAPRWSETGFNGVARDQALAECRFEAQKATSGNPNGFQAGFQQGELEKTCMQAKGFSQVR